tara:strand:- start:830 stop:1057 length:228 start_codon:yes stop_codon:yes gene_type:complete
MPGDSEESAIYETNQLGEDTGFGTFWGTSGLRVLMEIVDNNPEQLSQVTILDDHRKKLSISEFLERIAGLKVRMS